MAPRVVFDTLAWMVADDIEPAFIGESSTAAAAS
jgi:hypothetical protein